MYIARRADQRKKKREKRAAQSTGHYSWNRGSSHLSTSGTQFSHIVLDPLVLSNSHEHIKIREPPALVCFPLCVVLKMYLYTLVLSRALSRVPDTRTPPLFSHTAKSPSAIFFTSDNNGYGHHRKCSSWVDPVDSWPPPPRWEGEQRWLTAGSRRVMVAGWASCPSSSTRWSSFLISWFC
jgi:hypothetical protein